MLIAIQSKAGLPSRSKHECSDERNEPCSALHYEGLRAFAECICRRPWFERRLAHRLRFAARSFSSLARQVFFS